MSTEAHPVRRLDVRRQLVLGYLVLRLGNVVVMGLSDDMSPSLGFLDVVLVAALVIGMWRGSRLAWTLALALEVFTLAVILLATAAPWSTGMIALFALNALRVAVLLQRPLRPKPAPRRAAGGRRRR